MATPPWRDVQYKPGNHHPAEPQHCDTRQPPIKLESVLRGAITHYQIVTNRKSTGNPAEALYQLKRHQAKKMVETKLSLSHKEFLYIAKSGEQRLTPECFLWDGLGISPWLGNRYKTSDAHISYATAERRIEPHFRISQDSVPHNDVTPRRVLQYIIKLRGRHLTTASSAENRSSEIWKLTLLPERCVNRVTTQASDCSQGSVRNPRTKELHDLLILLV